MTFRISSREDFQRMVLRKSVIIPLIILVAGIFVFVLPNWNNIRNMFFITLFLILGSLSYFYRRFFDIRLGIEFCSVGTFLCTLAYGTGVGFFVGNVTAIISELIGSKIDERIIINLISYNAIVLATPFVAGLAQTNMMLAALIINIFYNLIGVTGNMLLGGNPAKTIIFVSTNLFWTAAFFLRIGPIVYYLMIH